MSHLRSQRVLHHDVKKPNMMQKTAEWYDSDVLLVDNVLVQAMSSIVCNSAEITVTCHLAPSATEEVPCG